MLCTLDTETCGLYGMPVLLQYAWDDEPVQLYDIWKEPVRKTLDLLEQIADSEVIGFNLAFDWFHLCKLYTTFRLLKTEYPIPKDVAGVEREAMLGPCLKPRTSFDVMLHARKTELQMTMERSDVRIRRIPVGMAWNLAAELERAIEFDNILFARSGNKLAPKWKVMTSEDKEGNVDPNFRTLMLKFKASTALKAMAVHVLGIDPEEVTLFSDIEVPKKLYPKELGYAPFATATKKNWLMLIKFHIEHWAYQSRARKYAENDVIYTRSLYKHFGSPERDDVDSVLATLVAAVRWRGYALDIPKLKKLHNDANELIKKVPISSKRARDWIREVMEPEERLVFKSTAKVGMTKYIHSFSDKCCKVKTCELCKGSGVIPRTPAAQRMADVLEARIMKHQIGMYKKLIDAGRFHASFRVIGALSTRMSGADGLNPQGINRVKEVRECFLLADGGLVLWGGDFSGFEVVLADAAYNDKLLRQDLLTCEKCRNVQVTVLKEPVRAGDFCPNYKGNPDDILHTFACPKCGSNKRMKIHALFGVHVYPDMGYDQIKATDGTADDRYNKSKSAVFAMIYGGEAYTLMTRLGVPLEVAEEAYERFIQRYVGVGLARERIINDFQTLRQTEGIGSAISYTPAKEYVESLLGFRRYFTLENKIVAALIDMAQDLPESLKNVKIKVRRRDRLQTSSGAVQSALYGTAFGIQASNMRAAANHEIQSSGAQITKEVQRKIWDLQPHGAHPWLVQPCNIHDEILCPLQPEIAATVKSVVHDSVESFRPKVPLIEFGWKPMANWASK